MDDNSSVVRQEALPGKCTLRVVMMGQESIPAWNEGIRWWGGVEGPLTLDGFGVLLDLTVGRAADHIPHDDLSRGIS